MDLFRKVFLFMVGTAAIAYEEASKALDEVAREIEKQRQQITGKEPLKETQA